MIQLRLLGPLSVRYAAKDQVPPGTKLKAILAALALRPQRLVHREQLIEELALADSKNAVNALQAHVTRLRRWLAYACQEPDLVVTIGQSYQLNMSPAQVDAHEFVRLAEQGWAMPLDQPEGVVSTMEHALMLWRGFPLTDAGDGPIARSAADWLNQVRLGVQESLLDARLAMGDERRVVLQATGFIATDPLRERLWEQLLMALHLSGQHAEAIHAFHRLRELLADELGVEPGHRVRSQLQDVLAGRPPRTFASSAPSPTRVSYGGFSGLG
jgi:DNA-binding SARP family transcriptional activator